jgi:hypothetical protein
VYFNRRKLPIWFIVVLAEEIALKRKPPSQPPPLPEVPAVAPEILEGAKAAILFADKPRRTPTRCVVCNSDTSPNSNEGLCWVCRRLKISAWRDSDTQMPAQE